ncbi:hypothetical protein CYY_006106 [Polysphondylium violaceum]|uniref:Leucine-rich repeat-containing protein n=1 Tax=Polysphondylium violaceum TaxID=133409 RepID=A0A8J4UZ72_9MYCE|nr:hypothetical protein CYY_006106 [Polysphondylium violaceum]
MSIIIPGRYELVNRKYTVISKDILEPDVSKDLNDLIKYHILDISGNMIEEIQINSITCFFSHITELYFINNELKEIPVEINNLTSLKKLYLSKNKLIKISNLDKLKDLEVLDLRANRIKEIDCESLNQNLNLNYLTLSNNQIESISNLPLLVKLHSFFLFSNQISDFNQFVKDLVSKTPNLSKLLIEGNPMLSGSSDYKTILKSNLKQLVTLDFNHC